MNNNKWTALALSPTLMFAPGASACDYISRTDPTHVDAGLLCKPRRDCHVGVGCVSEVHVDSGNRTQTSTVKGAGTGTGAAGGLHAELHRSSCRPPRHVRTGFRAANG